jgi:hypothetical protein
MNHLLGTRIVWRWARLGLTFNLRLKLLAAGDPKRAVISYGICRVEMSDHPHFHFFLYVPPFQSFTFTLLPYKLQLILLQPL